MLWDLFELFKRIDFKLRNNAPIQKAIKDDLDGSSEARLMHLREGAEQLIKMIEESIEGK